ncbi:MAG: class II aldolase/adducin family protein [Christensenellales bacterium]
MKNEKIVATVVDYAKKLAGERVCGGKDMIAMRADDEMYVTKVGVDFASITADDVDVLTLEQAYGEYKLFADVFKAREDIKAICHCYPAWIQPLAKVGATIPAVLDDMAQIVGPTCKTSLGDSASIIKTLKGRNSCLIKNDGCLTSGRTMDEAYTCVLVLDKAAHCYVSSAVIGKNVIINGIEARLMRFIYKVKYSKKNQENLKSAEGEA